MSDTDMHGPGFAVVDVETTGFSAVNDRIIEVAVVVLDPSGTEVDAFCTLLDPGRDPGPTHVHGVTAAMVDGAPTFDAVRPYLAHLLSGRVVVGHNVVRFDLGFLRQEFLRLPVSQPVPLSIPVVDTLRVAQTHLGLFGQARLVDCCDHYGLSWEEHHSALGDARATAELLVAMRAHLGDGLLGLAEATDAASQTVWPGAIGVTPPSRQRPSRLAG